MAILSGEATQDESIIKVMSVCFTVDTPLDETWHQVDSVPEYPPVEIGKKAERFFNTVTKEFTFVISDRPLTRDEEKDREIERLRALLDDATNLLLETGGL